MLTKEILKTHIGGLQAALKFETVEPFAVFAERWFRDQVGPELLNYLAGLQNPAPGTNEADLLYLAQSCMSWKAYELAFPHLKLRAGDLGLQKVNSQNTVAVAKWEYVDSREANLAMLDLALENFWQTVEHIRPTAWTSSMAYQKRQRAWIRSASELAQYIPTLGRKSRLFDQLVTYVLRAELVYIKPILTESVYADQKAKWKDSTYTLTDTEQTLLETIRPALAHLALYEAYPYLPLTLDTTGITERRSKDGVFQEVAPNSDSKNNQKRQLYLDGQFYLAQLQAFLKETATATQWPGFYQANLTTGDDGLEPDFTHQSLVIL